jgi:hypothetical protein
LIVVFLALLFSICRRQVALRFLLLLGELRSIGLFPARVLDHGAPQLLIVDFLAFLFSFCRSQLVLCFLLFLGALGWIGLLPASVLDLGN